MVWFFEWPRRSLKIFLTTYIVQPQQDLPDSISLYGSQFTWLAFSLPISQPDSHQAILDLGRWCHQQETIPDQTTQDRDWLTLFKLYDVTSASDDPPGARKPLLDYWFETEDFFGKGRIEGLATTWQGTISWATGVWNQNPSTLPSHLKDFVEDVVHIQQALCKRSRGKLWWRWKQINIIKPKFTIKLCQWLFLVTFPFIFCFYFQPFNL